MYVIVSKYKVKLEGIFLLFPVIILFFLEITILENSKMT
jgi:hypothetical protein